MLPNNTETMDHCPWSNVLVAEADPTISLSASCTHLLQIDLSAGIACVEDKVNLLSVRSRRCVGRLQCRLIGPLTTASPLLALEFKPVSFPVFDLV